MRYAYKTIHPKIQVLIKKSLHHPIAETTRVWLIPCTDILTLTVVMEALAILCGLSNLNHSQAFFSEVKMALGVCCIFNREKDGKDVLQTIDGVLEERNDRES